MILGSLDTVSEPQAVKVAGGFAFVAEGRTGLRIYDLSVPEQPVPVGAVDTPGHASDVEVSNGLAYVADGTNGLVIVDVSNPAAPMPVGGLRTPGGALRVAVEGDRAYLADGSDEIHIVDVSNPASPVTVGRIEAPRNQQIAVADGLAYVATFDFGLSIFDVSDPAAPLALSAYGERASDVEVMGSLAYVTASGGFHILDVSNPSAPTLVGDVRFGPLVGGSNVEVAGGFAFVASGRRDAGLVVLDVSNPQAPLVVGNAAGVDDIRGDFEVLNQLVYAPSGFSGLQVISLSNSQAPVEIANYTFPGANGVRDVHVSGGIAYVASDFGGIRILDVANPENPIEIGSIPPDLADAPRFPGIPQYILPGGLEIDEGLAYVAVSDDTSFLSRLEIYDVSDPGAPSLLGFSLNSYLADFEISSSVAYLSTLAGIDKLRMLDISEPQALQIIKNLAVPYTIEGVAVRGGLACLAAGRSGLRVLDVSNPAQPVEVGALDSPFLEDPIDVAFLDDTTCLVTSNYSSSSRSVLVSIDVSDPSAPRPMGGANLWAYESDADMRIDVFDGVAYLSGDETGLHIVDVTAREDPIYLGRFDPPGSAYAAAVEAGLLYLADGAAGARVIDLARMPFPRVVSTGDPSGTPSSVVVEGDLAFLVHGDSGVRIIDVSDPGNPLPSGTIETPHPATGVDVVGDRAYVTSVTDRDATLQTVDVSNPPNPRELGSTQYVGGAPDSNAGKGGRIVVRDGIAYVDAHVAGVGFRTFDVSNPFTPREIGIYTGSAWNLDVAGSFAYVIPLDFNDPLRGLIVVDVSNPTHPVEIGRAPSPELIKVRAFGGFAYAMEFDSSRYDSTLRIFDVSNPSAPLEVGAQYLPDPMGDILPYGLDADGRSVYAAVGGPGVRVVDVSDPTAPLLRSSIVVPSPSLGDSDHRDSVRDVAVANGLAYLADISSGLQIVDFRIPRPVDVEVRPGSKVNSVVTTGGGVIPVAVLGSEEFDVAEIDVETLAFAPGGARPVHSAGGHLEDVNRDGRADLVSHYRSGETGLSSADTEACVIGETLAGRLFEGCDAIRVLAPPGDAP